VAGSDRKASHVDVHVGLKIRMRRKRVGLTQQGLAEALGLTFQQVQKYERGANRVSASKLYHAAEVLGVTVGYFFEGLPETGGRAPERRTRALDDLMGCPEGRELAASFARLPGARVRRKLVELLHSMAERSS
jgi:transcriptional regulator with XRE-family HTH domain